jgi:hypothetical protein
MDSISFTADGLMKTLYLGMLLQILEDLFETQIRFGSSFLKGEQVFSIFSKPRPDSLVHEI